MILTRTPLRISLAGGGSDLPSHYEEHGGAVVSFTINKYIYITAKPNVSLFPHKYRLVYSRVEECNDRTEIEHPIIRRLVDDYGLGSLDLDVMSDVPAGTGLGSSSAFTVGLHRALWGAGNDKHGLAAQACHTEITDLKEPIGRQDQYAAAFGGLNYFHFAAERTSVTPISLTTNEVVDLEHSLLLVYVGGTRSASALLKDQGYRCNTENLRAMADLATEMARCLRDGRIDDIGAMIDMGWELKKELSPLITNDKIDTIIAEAKRNGASGGKLLGAGGAGFVLLFCPNYTKYAVQRALAELDARICDFEIDMEGCKVLYEE